MPEEEPKIYGDFEPSEIEEEKERLTEARRRGGEPIEGEIEKNDQDIVVINFINQSLAEEMRMASLENSNLLGPERLHFLSDNKFSEILPGEKAAGVYFSYANAACFNLGKIERPKLYRMIMHEQIHALTYHSMGVVRQPDGEAGMAFLRGGVNMVNPYEASHEHFLGANEALINWVELYLWDKYKKEFKERFGFDLKDIRIEIEPSEYEVSREMALMDIIFRGVAKTRGESFEETRARFIKSIFSGRVFHFKDIEKTFGRGSLRVLSVLGDSDEVLSQKQRIEKSEKILRYFGYFGTIDQKEKDRIASEVLGERERFRYRQRRETERRENNLIARAKRIFGEGFKRKK